MSKKLLKTFVTITAIVSMLSTGTVAFAADNYVVQSGDYLSKIAKQEYGDEAKWEIIYEANKDSIKNPNIIYQGQVLAIPGLNGEQAAPETAAAQETPAEEAAPAAEASPAPVAVKNIPVGANPVAAPDNCQRYTFSDGNWIDCKTDGTGYIQETTDAYGVTYREYRPGANETAMKEVAEYIAQNPDSNFASLIKNYGSQFVIVSSWLGLWDDTYDYDWSFDIVECEPEDCVYIFLAGNTFDGGYEKDACEAAFNAVSDNITIEE